MPSVLVCTSLRALEAYVSAISDAYVVSLLLPQRQFSARGHFHGITKESMCPFYETVVSCDILT